MAAYEKSKSVKLKSISTMTEGTIWRQILLFSIPLILGNLLQQMYNTVDSIIVGNFVGSNALAAVGSSTSLICLLIAFSMGASAGAGVIVSQFYGAGDENGVQRSAHTALMLALILGIVLTIAGIVFSPAILRWMRTPEEVMNQSVLYFGMLPVKRTIKNNKFLYRQPCYGWRYFMLLLYIAHDISLVSLHAVSFEVVGCCSNLCN